MIKRYYFISAKCTESTGYCYISRIGAYTSFLPDSGKAYDLIVGQVKKELLEIRPNGNFEVTSFNKV